MRSLGIELMTSLNENFIKISWEKCKENYMWWVGIEPTTSWMDERVRRKIKEKIKCGEWGLNPQPLELMRELREK